jgi:hypothetical protein
MNQLYLAMQNQFFVEKLILLITGAILTGLLIPSIKWIIDFNHFRQQRLFEEDLAQKRELVKAKSEFIRLFSELSWRFQYLCLEVIYSKLWLTQSEYSKTIEAYNSEAWKLIKEIRSAIGGARWFVDDSVYDKLMDFYENWLLQIDLKLSELIKPNVSNELFKLHHCWLHDNSRILTDSMLYNLSIAFGFKTGEPLKFITTDFLEIPSQPSEKWNKIYLNIPQKEAKKQK